MSQLAGLSCMSRIALDYILLIFQPLQCYLFHNCILDTASSKTVCSKLVDYFYSDTSSYLIKNL